MGGPSKTHPSLGAPQTSAISHSPLDPAVGDRCNDTACIIRGTSVPNTDTWVWHPRRLDAQSTKGQRPVGCWVVSTSRPATGLEIRQAITYLEQHSLLLHMLPALPDAHVDVSLPRAWAVPEAVRETAVQLIQSPTCNGNGTLVRYTLYIHCTVVSCHLYLTSISIH